MVTWEMATQEVTGEWESKYRNGKVYPKNRQAYVLQYRPVQENQWLYNFVQLTEWP